MSMKKIYGFLLLLLVGYTIQANNVKITGEPVLTLNSARDSVEIAFTLSWDNSWRDELNWDAVWVFVKFKPVRSVEAWRHLNLGSIQTLPVGLTYDCGITAGQVKGVFVYRAVQGNGNVVDRYIRLRASLAAFGGFSAVNIENREVYVSVSAIEMVLVPYGAYYLGDTTANYGFTLPNAGGALCIESENTVSLSVMNGGAVNVPVNYPKGYRGFYAMKYELTQEQYVSFLNKLDYKQQKVRVGNNPDLLKRGDYVFGDKSRPTARNGITVLSLEQGRAAMFVNNLNPAAPFNAGDDGQTIACNFLTPEDMLAYCDWAGLRPMSEMEFEKSCRRPYPQPAVVSDFAWNNRNISKLSGESDLDAALLNTETERPNDINRNVNAGNGFGPVRSGSFSTGTTNQTQAGGTFWGLMEMSGNVGELCYNANVGNGFNTSVVEACHGDGTVSANGMADVSAAYWPAATNLSAFAIRGGNYTSVESRLRVSDRSVLSVSAIRDSTVGFRTVRSLPAVSFSAGEIVCMNGLKQDTICPDTKIRIVSRAAGTGKGERISYIWYLKREGDPFKVIPNQSGEELKALSLENKGAAILTYQIKRKAVFTTGEAETGPVTLKILNTSFKLSKDSIMLDGCGNTVVVNATPVATGVTPVYQWSYLGKVIGTTSVYRAAREHFDGANGDMDVICRMDILGCSATHPLVVRAPYYQEVLSTGVTLDNCNNVLAIDSRDNKRYCLTKVGTQCWMAQNLNILENRKCYNDNPAYCDAEGGMYVWDVAMNSCLAGWHLPSNAEWNQMFSALGGGTTAATKLRSPSWCTGANCNSSGFNGNAGGWYYGTGSSCCKENGYWWTSTVYSATTRGYVGLAMSVAISPYDKGSATNVRCVKD